MQSDTWDCDAYLGDGTVLSTSELKQRLLANESWTWGISPAGRYALVFEPGATLPAGLTGLTPTTGMADAVLACNTSLISGS